MEAIAPTFDVFSTSIKVFVAVQNCVCLSITDAVRSCNTSCHRRLLAFSRGPVLMTGDMSSCQSSDTEIRM